MGPDSRKNQHGVSQHHLLPLWRKALLPLATGSGRLENLNAYVLHWNSEGAVLAEGPGLVVFDAGYGPGATIDAAPDDNATATNPDYLVPTNEIHALDSVISEMKISGTNEDQKLLAVQNFFAGKLTYSLWQGPDKLATTNETSLTRFLLTAGAAIANTSPPPPCCCCARWESPRATPSVTLSTNLPASRLRRPRSRRARVVPGVERAD